MVTPGVRLFSDGDTVWLQDGRQGLVVSAAFNDDGGFWEYRVEGFEFLQVESDLLASDPLAPPEVVEIQALPPAEEQVEDVRFVTTEELRGLVVGILETAGVPGVEVADREEIIRAAVEQSSLILDANLQALTENVVLPLRQELVDLEAQFRELESAITTTLSEIEKRSTEIDAAADEDGDGGILGFFGRVGSIIRSPVDWFIDKIFGFLVGEWLDGNSR